MKDKELRRVIFGKCEFLGEINDRGITITFPAKEDGDKERKIQYAGDDGIVLYLLKRIEKLEEIKGRTNKT